MRVGAIPVPVSTMLRADGIAELLRDSRARFLAVTGEFAAVAESAAAAAPELAGRTGRRSRACCQSPASSPARRPGRLPARRLGLRHHGRLPGVLALHLGHHRDAEGRDAPARVHPGGLRDLRRPGARHHAVGPLPVGREGVLRLRPRQLGAVPAVGRRGLRAAAVAVPARPDRGDRRQATARRSSSAARRSSPTCSGPGCRPDALGGVRLAASAGEALPASLYARWTAQFGIDIIDGIGMTEMLHIFLSNAPGAVRPGTTGVAVPGYDLKLVDEESGREITAARHPRHPVRARRVRRDRLLGPLRRVPAGLPGRVAAHRRHLRPRRRRVLRVPRPDRRHDQGVRHLGLPDGGRDPAAVAPGRRPGGGGRRPGPRRPGEAGRLRACSRSARSRPRRS